MSAGTLTLTNKSATVTGSGTSFTTELKANDFAVFTVGQTTYTLAVKAVVSDTEITLAKIFTGPTASGLTWNAMPVATLVLITSEIVAQSTEALRSQNYDRYNWEQVYSQSKNITVTLSDGSTFTGPSWKKIADLLAGLDPVELQQIADDVRQDAQQVSADKATAQNASDIATQKAAETLTNANAAAQSATQATAANTSAQDAKNAAADSAAAAAASAGSIDTSAFLRKDDNLAGVEDKGVSRTNISAAKSGINSDITKISGLTTPLEVSQGGGGASTPAGIRTNLTVPSGVDKQMITAWVSFSVNPTTFGITISDSFNVSSVTRASAGAYYVNFANSMLNANYAAIGMVRAPNTVVAAYTGYALLNDTKTTTQVVVRAAYSTGTSAGGFDPSEFTVYIIGGK